MPLKQTNLTLFRHLIVVVCIASICGCESRINQNFQYVNFKFDGKGTHKIAVATLDMRSYVLNKRRTDDFVGFFGGAKSLTASGLPLAKEFTSNVAYTLSQNGFAVMQLEAIAPYSLDNFIAHAKNTSSNRSILITIKEWQSDAFFSTSLAYDLNLIVINENGEILAKNELKGDGNIKDGIMITADTELAALRKVFKQKLESLMNNAEILEALK